MSFYLLWIMCNLDNILTQRIEHQKIIKTEPLLAFSYSEGVINPEDKKLINEIL